MSSLLSKYFTDSSPMQAYGVFSAIFYNLFKYLFYLLHGGFLQKTYCSNHKNIIKSKVFIREIFSQAINNINSPFLCYFPHLS